MEILAGALIAGVSAVLVAWLNNRRGKATLAELRPNGGTSMRDLLDRVAEKQLTGESTINKILVTGLTTEQNLVDLRHDLRAHIADVAAHIQSTPPEQMPGLPPRDNDDPVEDGE